MKRPEGLHAELYIASDAIHRDNHMWAYSLIIPLLDRAGGGYGMDSSDVRVVDGDAPLAAAAIAMQVTAPGLRSRPLGRGPVGNVYAEDLYVYPPMAMLAAAG